MSAEPWSQGVGRLILETVDSTNAYAVRKADTLPAPFWVMAREQTGGRGRRGRPWISPPGNLYATCLLRPTGAADIVALRSFAAALALHEACAALTGRPEALTLKWPNDVLLNGGKLAGILLEAQGSGTLVDHLAIGIGVNLASAPPTAMVEPGAVRPVSLRDETGIVITPEDFLNLLAPALARWEATFVTQGFAPLRAAWLARAARLGQTLRARTGQAEHHGIFETVDAKGALVLRTGTGPLAIPAAEVFF